MDERDTSVQPDGEPIDLDSQGEDEEGLRKFIERLLSHPVIAFYGEAHLLVGQTPHQLPVMVPIPEGARILGTLRLPTGLHKMLLDVDLPPDGVLGAYREELLSDGWTEQDAGPSGGFMQMPPDDSRSSCFERRAGGPQLSVRAIGRAGGSTDVRLDLQLRPQQPLPNVGPIEWFPVLPTLAPPPNVHRQSLLGGAPFRRGVANSTAVVSTDWNLTDLTGHYVRQLEEAGWSHRADGQSDYLAWSTWALPPRGERQATAYFQVVQRPDYPQVYWLHIQAAEIVGSRPPGWRSDE